MLDGCIYEHQMWEPVTVENGGSALRMYGTPKATHSKRSKAFRKGVPNMKELEEIENQKNWLTPSTIQIQPKEGRYEKRKAYRESIGRHWVPGCLEEQAAMWPTPTTVEHYDKRGKRKEGGGCKPNLTTTIINQMWPTATVSDKNCGCVGMIGKQHLSTVIEYEVPGHTTPQTRPPRLSPLWVEWLMGFPKGWTDLNVSVTQWFPNKQEKHGRY